MSAQSSVQIKPWAAGDLPLLEQLMGDPAMIGPAVPPPVAAADPEESALAEIVDTTSHVLRELRSFDVLPWSGLPVSAVEVGSVRAEVDALSRQLRSFPRPSPRRLRSSVDRIRLRTRRLGMSTLEALGTEAHGSFWQFEGETMSEFDQIASTAMSCPNCKRDSARSAAYRHRVESAMLMHLTFCRRCGDQPIAWQAVADTIRNGPGGWTATAADVRRAPRRLVPLH